MREFLKIVVQDFNNFHQTNLRHIFRQSQKTFFESFIVYTHFVVLNRRQNPLHHDITLAQLLTGFISYSYCTEAICKVLFWYVAQSVLAKVKPEKPLDPSFISYDLTAQCRYLPANYEIRISRVESARVLNNFCVVGGSRVIKESWKRIGSQTLHSRS